MASILRRWFVGKQSLSKAAEKTADLRARLSEQPDVGQHPELVGTAAILELAGCSDPAQSCLVRSVDLAPETPEYVQVIVRVHTRKRGRPRASSAGLAYQITCPHYFVHKSVVDICRGWASGYESRKRRAASGLVSDQPGCDEAARPECFGVAKTIPKFQDTWSSHSETTESASDSEAPWSLQSDEDPELQRFVDALPPMGTLLSSTGHRPNGLSAVPATEWAPTVYADTEASDIWTAASDTEDCTAINSGLNGGAKRAAREAIDAQTGRPHGPRTKARRSDDSSKHLALHNIRSGQKRWLLQTG